MHLECDGISLWYKGVQRVSYKNQTRKYEEQEEENVVCSSETLECR